MKSAKVWLLGLLAAFITGGASGIVSGFTATAIDPSAFNWTNQLTHTLQLMLLTFIVSGIIGAAAYLRQSPIPREQWTATERAQKIGELKKGAAA